MHAMFGQFGTVLDVVCKRTYRLRGQAWVVFENPGDAQKAMTAMQGFPFFSRPIRISLASSKSDAAAKLDGSYEQELVERRKQEGIKKREMYFEKVKARSGRANGGRLPGTAPNKILFLEYLPEVANEESISVLFKQYPGFKEVRMVTGRPDIAFVEYENDMGASVAMQGLQGFQLSADKAMKISFAKQ